jgi:hypothetical protein
MLRIVRGEEVALTTTLRRNRQPVNISTWDIKAAIRRTANQPTAVAECTVSLLPQQGTFRLSLSSEVTADILPGEYILSVRLHQPSGMIRTVNQRIAVNEDDNW